MHSLNRGLRSLRSDGQGELGAAGQKGQFQEKSGEPLRIGGGLACGGAGTLCLATDVGTGTWWWRPGMLLTILQCTERSPQQRIVWAPSVNSGTTENHVYLSNHNQR